LRHEFASESFGENRLGELPDVCFGFRVARFDLVRQFKQSFNAKLPGDLDPDPRQIQA
jgi:hypothetical protein